MPPTAPQSETIIPSKPNFPRSTSLLNTPLAQEGVQVPSFRPFVQTALYLLRQKSLSIGKVTGSREIFDGVGTIVFGPTQGWQCPQGTEQPGRKGSLFRSSRFRSVLRKAVRFPCVASPRPAAADTPARIVHTLSTAQSLSDLRKTDMCGAHRSSQLKVLAQSWSMYSSAVAATVLRSLSMLTKSRGQMGIPSSTPI